MEVGQNSAEKMRVGRISLMWASIEFSQNSAACLKFSLELHFAQGGVLEKLASTSERRHNVCEYFFERET